MSIDISCDVRIDEYTGVKFLQLIEELQCRYVRHFYLSTNVSEETLKTFFNEFKKFTQFHVSYGTAAQSADQKYFLFYDRSQSLIIYGYAPGEHSLYIDIAANTKDDADAVELFIRSKWPPYENPVLTENKISVGFWFNSNGKVVYKTRKLAIPPWDNCSYNYDESVYNQLTNLFQLTEKPSGGKIAIWTGPPGTGKTHAIRRLIHEWKSWCNAEYIIDPENFFGSAGYMMDAVFGRSPEYVDDEDTDNSSKFRLLIAEDAGELVSLTAKGESGQGLSRLLNMADGILGQGLNTLFLITTNEPIEKLHEAVSRQGRCFSNICFDYLTKDQGNAWLKANNKAGEVISSTIPLADLYAGNLNPSNRKKTGFR